VPSVLTRLFRECDPIERTLFPNEVFRSDEGLGGVTAAT
jgi:hypothetical protein